MKPDNKPTRYRPIYIGCFIMVLIIGTWGPAILGDRNDPWWKFVYEFQTLIAGTLAVFAAYLSIAQMRFSEESQELRHRELVEKSENPTRLLVDREVRLKLTLLSGIKKNIEKISTQIVNDDLDMDITLRNITITFQRVLLLVGDHNTTQIRTLYNANLHLCMSHLYERKQEFEDIVSDTSNVRNKMSHSTDAPHKYAISDLVKHCVVQAAYIREDIDIIDAEFTALLRRYQ